MATKQQVQRAAVRRYGKHAYIEWGGAASSPELREAANARNRENKLAKDAAAKVVAEFRKEYPETNKALINAARFVLDTDGCKTALDALRPELELAERLAELVDAERVAAREYFDARKGATGYYFKYRCSVAMPNAPIPMATVEHEADTLDELLAKIKTARSNSGRIVTKPIKP